MDKVPPEKPETDAAVAFEMAAAAERDREEGTTMRSSDEDTLRREDLVRDAVLNELSEEPLVDSLTGEAPEPSEIHHLPVRVKRWPRWRNRLRLYMLFPHRSKLGRALQWAFRSFVICSVITLIAETLPFARTDPSEVTNRTFYALDMLWSASFTLEFLLRCISMASWRYEFASWWTLVDFLSSIPFYVQLIVANVTRSYDGTDNLALRDGIRLLRLFRVVRLFKLGHHNTTMQLLLASLSSSKQGISTLFIGFPLLSVFWGSVFYYFESLSCYQGKDGLWYYHGNDKLSSFQSILDGIWFAMVTLATVGYGDIVVVTWQGKAAAYLAILTGIFIMAFPLTIIQTSFSTVLTRYKEKAELVREGNAVHPATRKTGVASQTLDVRLHVLDGDVASLARLLVRLQSETHLHIEVLGPSGSNSPLNPASI